MNYQSISEFINLFCGGLLAGLEMAAHYGFHAPTVALEAKSQIVLRQGIARRLRWIAPALFLPTLISGIAIVLPSAAHAGFVWRLGALLALVCWIVTRIVGTVSINAATIEWNPEAPPANWREQIGRAECFHILGTWAAMLAFAFFLVALGGRPR